MSDQNVPPASWIINYQYTENCLRLLLRQLLNWMENILTEIFKWQQESVLKLFFFILRRHFRDLEKEKVGNASAGWWHIPFFVSTHISHFTVSSVSTDNASVLGAFFVLSQRGFWCNVPDRDDGGAAPCLPNRLLTNKPSCRSCSPSTRRTTSSTPSKFCRRKSSWRRKRYGCPCTLSR